MDMDGLCSANYPKANLPFSALAIKKKEELVPLTKSLLSSYLLVLVYI